MDDHPIDLYKILRMIQAVSASETEQNEQWRFFEKIYKNISLLFYK